MLRALGRPITGEEWVWLSDGAGQRLYHPPDVSGWDDKRWLDSNTIRARWDLVNSVVAGRSIDPGSATARAYPAETPEQAVAAARAFWLDPRLEPETADWLLAYARQFQPPADDASTPQYRREQRAQTRAQRQNALRHLIAVSADYQTQLMPDSTSTSRACGCAGFSRSELLRGGGAATAGRGLRAIEAGMPLPAGTGLSRRSFLARSSGLALAVFGGAALAPRALDAGIAAAEAAGEHRILVSIFCSGGMDSLSLLAPVGDPRYAAAARHARAAARTRVRVRRGLPPALAPGRGAAARPARRGQAERDPGDRLRRPEPVALHLAPLLGGRRHRPGRPRRLARPLPRPPRRRRQPAPGPLARLHARARRWPPPACPSPPSPPRSPTTCGRATSGTTTLFDAAVARWGAQGALATADPELADRPPRRRA